MLEQFLRSLCRYGYTGMHRLGKVTQQSGEVCPTVGWRVHGQACVIFDSFMPVQSQGRWNPCYLVSG